MFRALLLIIAFLTLAGIASDISRFAFHRDTVFGLVRLFDLDREANVPSWYASTALLASSILLLAISRVSPPSETRRWRILAIVFLLAAIDEAAELHEIAGMILARFVRSGGVFHFTWVLLAIPLLIALAVAFLPLIFGLPARIRNLCLLAGVVFVSGAAGMEMINGAYADVHGYNNVTYKVLSDVEECLEMTGVAIWIYALLSHLALQKQAPAFVLKSE